MQELKIGDKFENPAECPICKDYPCCWSDMGKWVCMCGHIWNAVATDSSCYEPMEDSGPCGWEIRLIKLAD